MPKKSESKLITRITTAWVFPLLLLIPLVFFTITKISGTSVGIYHQLLYGPEQKNPSLVLGEPRPIRSDEWLFVTQMTIAQSKEGFPKVNQNINSGRDMSLITDVPYKEWSTIFKPQNLAYFIMPLENAFAFKWWLLLYLLIVSSYFFVLRLFPKQYFLSALFASGFALSPFVFWWYQTATIAPLFYGFFMLLLGVRIINRERIGSLSKQASNIVHLSLLTYVLVCFALILYPPFQIPVALVVLAFFAGYLLQNHSKDKKALLKSAGLLAIPLVISSILVGIFLFTRHDAVSSIQDTVYPGKRLVKSGGIKPFQLLSTEFQVQLQRKERAVNYFTNQSEASNFILLIPFLLLPGVIILWRQWKQRCISFVYLALHIIAVIFLARMTIPYFDPLYRLIGLASIPHERLFIGLGFVGFIQLIYTAKFVHSFPISKKVEGLITIYSTLVFLVLIYAGRYLKHTYPKYISSTVAIVFLSLVMTSIVYLLLRKKTLLAAVVFSTLSLVSVALIHPLYKGLGPIYNSSLTKKIEASSNNMGSWAVVDDIQFENLALVSGEDSLTGIQIYPDLGLWRQIGGTQYDTIYNRYAHTIFNSDPGFSDPIRLIQFDSFQIKFACDDFVQRNVQYVVATHALIYPCTTQIDQVNFPAKQFFIYKISR